MTQGPEGLAVLNIAGSCSRGMHAWGTPVDVEPFKQCGVEAHREDVLSRYLQEE